MARVGLACRALRCGERIGCRGMGRFPHTFPNSALTAIERQVFDKPDPISRLARKRSRHFLPVLVCTPNGPAIEHGNDMRAMCWVCFRLVIDLSAVDLWGKAFCKGAAWGHTHFRAKSRSRISLFGIAKVGERASSLPRSSSWMLQELTPPRFISEWGHLLMATSWRRSDAIFEAKVGHEVFVGCRWYARS